MSSSAKRHKRAEYGFIPSMKNYKDLFGNSYNITHIKRRNNKITSAQLRSAANISIDGHVFNLRQGQIITFHPNNILKSFYAEHIEINSTNFENVKVFIGSNGKIKTIISGSIRIKFINKYKKQFLLIEYFYDYTRLKTYLNKSTLGEVKNAKYLLATKH